MPDNCQLHTFSFRAARRRPCYTMSIATCGRWAVVLLGLLSAYGSLRAEDPGSYVVGSNDVLMVSVYGQPELSGKYTVEADGTFGFPLVGRLKAGDLTLRAIENELRLRLAAGYLRDPQVTVLVDQYRSQQVFVMGEVRQPGTLQFTGTMTLLEALARVGSTTDRAGPDAVIVRSGNGAAPPAAAELSRLQEAAGDTMVRVNLEALQTGAVSENIALGGGDTIFVPRAESVFVSGQVRSPGEYVLRKTMTVRQVLALAGGVTDRGSTRRIQIVRQVEGEETTIGANLQDIVRPGDTILVRERFF